MLVKVKAQASVGVVVDVRTYGMAEQLFRVTAWIIRLRFHLEAKKRGVEKRNRELTVEEFAQVSSSLGIFEEEGILKCKGRLENSELEHNAKYPIILPKKHRLTELIVRKCHAEVHHSGVQATLSRVQTKEGKGRQMVKGVVGKCVTCKRLEGKAYSAAPVASLPKFCVREAAPFSKVGIDFVGPIFVKDCANGSNKVYIALFSCCRDIFVLS